MFARLPAVDLRFPDKGHERQFKQALKKRMRLTGISMCCIIIVVAIVRYQQTAKEVTYTFPPDDPTSFVFWIQAIAFFGGPCLVLCIMLLGTCLTFFQRFDAELILTLLLSVVCVVLPLQGGWVAARLYGEDPDLVWVRDMRPSEGSVALTLDAITTGVCLFMPIRMVLKWIPAVMGLVSFAFCARVVGSPFSDMANLNIGVLCALSLFALWGAWTNEGVARKKFVAEGLVKKASMELEIQADVQQALIAEKTAIEMLLSMLCDAISWVNEETLVLKCDERFDMLIGTSMKGIKFSSCFTHEELVRMQTALKAASDIPTLLPTSIHISSGESEISVDCLIVRQSPETTATRNTIDGKEKEKQPDFLIGLRVSGQFPVALETCSQTYDKMQVLDIIHGLEAEESQMQNKSGKVERTDVLSTVPTSVLESVETTSTGRMFKDLTANPKRPSGSSEEDDKYAEIIRLARREGWLFEAKDVHLQPKEILGAGSFGIVVAAVLHGTRVAVKVPKKVDDRLDSKHLAAVANEIRILRHMRHPNIVLFFGAYLETASEEICLILEHITGTPLPEFVYKLQCGSEIYIRWRLSLDIACALRYIHAAQPRVVHGDLKASNIYVERGARAKLLDFGLARVLTKGVQSMGGSLKWMAPEVILVPKVRPRASSDVFSFGRVVYMVISGRQPLEKFERNAIIAMAKSGQTMPLMWPDDMPLKKECFDLCEKTSSFEQARRPTMKEVHAEVSEWEHGELDLAEQGYRFSVLHKAPRSLISDAGNEVNIDEVRTAMQHSKPCNSSSRVDDISDASSVSRFVLPNKKGTSLASKKLMLTMQAMQWNFPIPRASCCSWHAACNDIASVLHAMQERPCTATFLPHTQWQCKECGCLDIQPFCIICGSRGKSSSRTTVPEDGSSMSYAKKFSL